MKNISKYLDFNGEVAQALADKRPVVALESTIIAHGMPYPENVATAAEVENIIRDKGAVPATIALLKGKIKIGLTEEELDYLGSAPNIEKVSRRDLPFIIAGKKDGAVTVAGTMICAAAAGIRVFVTGGIGGVHRGVASSWDISADLTELMNTSVAVISAGVKSILDIGKTLEVLETYGVPVIGYKTADFPAFYSRKSGFPVDFRIDTPREVAACLKAKWELGLEGGVLIANPVPQKDAFDETAINAAIDTALKEAGEKGIKGKNITPFLLDKVKQITEGKSLVTNIALVKHNAASGAEIAAAYVRGNYK
ncbi:MAG: pseudouridine-5'-phosphate glycosidase [bacterium]|nr:pseudouridine-5'-phosphate glycosidase [bacterium]